MKISVIFSYRNRDVLRVDRCLTSLSIQSFKDFEVIFIDYGSDMKFSEAVKKVIDKYPFVRYYYTNVKGYPWNRSQALNIGVRLSSFDYILFGDIDLIYSPNVLEQLAVFASEDTQVYSSVYFLPKSFRRFKDLSILLPTTYPCSGDSGKGGVHLVSKKALETIRGYDEYYCFWGVEDRDLNSRLEQKGIKSVWIDRLRYPVYHQWHPIASNQTKGFFPDRWWDEMNIYYQINYSILERNDEKWGTLIKERPIENASPVPYMISRKYVKSYEKSALICDIIDQLSKISPFEFLEIKVRRNRTNKGISFFIRAINYIARKCLFPIGIDYMENVEQEKYSYLEDNIIYLVWQLIKIKKVILDYNIKEDKDYIVIQLMKN